MTTALVWLRRDLRLSDHAALSAALQEHARVIPVFVFDSSILAPLPRTDRRVGFILESLRELQLALQEYSSSLVIRTGDPEIEIPQLAAELDASAVYANRDYEPAATARDLAVAQSLAKQRIAWHDFKDQVIFERDEILTRSGSAFQVFTPYWNNWQQRLSPAAVAEYPVKPYCRNFAPLPPTTLPSLGELGFVCDATQSSRLPSGEKGAATLLTDFAERLDHYQQLRDYPAKKGPSYLSTHLRFGTVSIRSLVRLALETNSEGGQCWLKELCWREFYQQLLWHRPDLVAHTFRHEFDQLSFPNREDWFAAWCAGQTGYPLVDAGMRQLNQTGYMHNRLRMITASFLVKDLLIDWRWGERYFSEKLLDFDLASNSGGWQWAASVGCDAQPWFRIFNPVTQSQKFDPDGRFIRRYCPELEPLSNKNIHAPWLASPQELAAAGIRLGQHYPHPRVDHATQRQAALALFKAATNK